MANTHTSLFLPEEHKVISTWLDVEPAEELSADLTIEKALSELNLLVPTVVIHFTQAWNPALEAQASARAHRRGQTQPVHIYRLYYEDTVERVMIERSSWRRDLANEAVPVSTRDELDLERIMHLQPQVPQ